MKNNIKYSLLILSSLMISCFSEGEHSQDEEDNHHQQTSIVQLSDDQIQFADIQLGTIDEGVIEKSLTSFGELAVAPRDIAEIHLVHEAFVNDSPILPGEYVKKGQVLAYFSHPDILALQSEYLSSLQAEQQLKTDLERKQQLSEQNAISVKTRQEAEVKYFAQKVKRESLGHLLSKLDVSLEQLKVGNLQYNLAVRAPFDGIVTEVNIRRGMLVSPKNRMFEIVNLSEMHLEFEIYPKDIEHLHIGQLVKFHLPESNKKYVSHIHTINKKTDQGSILVHADIDDTIDIPLGASLAVQVVLVSDSMLILPRKAILQKGKKYFIYERIGENKFGQIEINVVEENDEYFGFTYFNGWESKKILVQGAYFMNTESGGDDH